MYKNSALVWLGILLALALVIKILHGPDAGHHIKATGMGLVIGVVGALIWGLIRR
jgi:hypothetical protein